jgi:elongation factor 1-beta
MSFGDLKTPAGLTALNNFLASASYIEGYQPTTADLDVLAQVGSAPCATKYPHAARWFSHISSFSKLKKARYYIVFLVITL